MQTCIFAGVTTCNCLALEPLTACFVLLDLRIFNPYVLKHPYSWFDCDLDSSNKVSDVPTGRPELSVHVTSKQQ